MACVTVTVVEALVVSIAEKAVKRKEKKKISLGEGSSYESKTMRFSEKLSLLKKMLWGGSALLLFEHIWHGEIVPFFPFFTAASSPDTLHEMLREMATTGVLMSVVVTGVWAIMMLAVSKIEKESENANTATESVS